MFFVKNQLFAHVFYTIYITKNLSGGKYRFNQAKTCTLTGLTTQRGLRDK